MKEAREKGFFLHSDIFMKKYSFVFHFIGECLKINPVGLRSDRFLVMGRTMFEVRSFEAKNRVFKFDYQKMNMFESVRCSKK